uniref:Junctional adhesion molecule B-like n=1 Tax=Scleropages formosus TaxID=113540 RepID=A0A8C9RWS4_SCLFO
DPVWDKWLCVCVCVCVCVLSGAWDVQYPKNEVCAVRGSTVVIPCTYVYPGKNHVQKMWCHHHKNCIDTKYVCHSRDINVSPEYKGRAECLGNEHQNCSLKVKNITDTDAGKYRFRFITNSNQWTGQDGVTLTITVSMKSLNKNGKIREGDSFNLTCATKGCSLSQSEFIWVKDKERLLETHSTLQFINVSCRHKGNYSCALKGGGDRSEEFQLDIQGEKFTLYFMPCAAGFGSGSPRPCMGQAVQLVYVCVCVCVCVCVSV